ncbi:hypothetical protein J6590_101891 [Homalodisca vitripennis]|nr:hypothetical protein J6590_101891 [Homalodisca vitripennis]
MNGIGSSHPIRKVTSYRESSSLPAVSHLEENVFLVGAQERFEAPICVSLTFALGSTFLEYTSQTCSAHKPSLNAGLECVSTAPTKHLHWGSKFQW